MKKKPGETARVGKEKKKKTGQKGQNKKEKKLRVLILEDNPVDAELMERQLKKAGISFISEQIKTRTAYQLALKKFLPDVILADYRLPKFDALQALALRNKNAPLTPFIITGSISEETAVECMKQGADDCLLKDRLARLAEAVQHSLEKHSLLKQKARVEETLRADELLYHTFIDSSSDMAFLKDDKFRHLLANRELCRFYKKTEKEIIGKADAELMGKSAAARCKKTDRQALAEKRIHVCEETIGDRTFETHKFSVKLADGRIGIGGYIRDITESKRTREMIEQSAKKWTTTFDAIKDGIALLAADQTIRQANRAFADQVAKPFSAIIGKKCYELVHSTRRPDPDCPFAKMLKSKKRESMELAIRDRLFAVIVDPITDDAGTITGATHILSDITERKQTEQALCESEDRYRDLVENSQGLICTHNLEGKLLSVNEATTRLTGYSKKELLRMNMEELLVPKVRRFFKAYLTEILEKGHSRGIMWIQTASGETRYWEYNNTLRTMGVTVSIVRGLAHDITERIQAEKQKEAALTALRESEDRYRDLVENSQELIYTHDLEGKLLSVNKMTAQLSGYPVKNLLGMKITTLLIPEVRQLFDAYLTEIKTSGRAHGHMRIRTAGGENRYWEYDNTLRTKGVPIPIVRGLAHDITERERAEKSIQASLQEKEILLKEIHHRVKNNLQIISGLLTLQAAQIDDERFQLMIRESQSRIWTMALIHQTLYQTGNLADIDMADYIRTLTGNLLSSHVRIAMPPTISFDLLPIRLIIDKAIPLALVINELVTNSLKHAFPDGRQGEIRITLHENTATCTAPHRAAYDLIVADDGAGLPAGFDPAIQKSLGLQLVSMLAKQLDGSMAIEASGGTSVRVTFIVDEKSKK